MLIYYRVDGRDDLYNASVYRAENDWKISIQVDNEHQTSVFRIQDGLEDEELTPIDVRRFSTSDEERSGWSRHIPNALRLGQCGISLGNLIMRIVEFCEQIGGV